MDPQRRRTIQRPTPRARTAAVALTLLLGACSARAPGPTVTGNESVLPGSPAPASSAPASSPKTPRSGATPDPSDTPTRTAAPPSPTYRDAGGVGEMARAYLRSAPARRMIVEVDYVRGRAPSQQALDHVRAILERELDKPDGVQLARGNEIPAARDEYTGDDIARLESQHRDRRSSGSTATMWIVYLNGDLADEDGALGIALSASTAALFADRIDGAATALIRPGAIERAVLTHEVGHLLALVNIGYRSDHDHEDPEHPKHSRFRDSVMYWAIEDISVASILGDGPPDDFGRFDRDDLRKLREG